MHARPWALAAISATLLTACPDPSAEVDSGADTGTDPDAVTGSTGPDQPGPSTQGEPTTTADPDGGGSDGSGDGPGDGSTDTGEPGGCYPPEVTRHLDLPCPLDDYDPPLPAHFDADAVQGFDNTPADNPITDAGATLGRVLFYDVQLSQNGTVACASCHQQQLGFSDDAAFSTGFAGGLTGRNSMGLANARFYAAGHFFWDERADTLEDQVLLPIQNEVEMGLTLPELLERVESQPYYAELFTQAFGDDTVSTERIAMALAQFVRAMTSYRTGWDEGIAAVGNPATDFPNYDAQQNRGKQVFLGPGRCAPCHLAQPPGPPPPPGSPLPNTAILMLTAAANNGLDAGPVTDDNGVGDVTGNPMQDGVFKSPSLRNVELTAPYMHDGRFDTLREVIDHYDSGVQDHPNLDPRLRVPPGGQPQRLNLTNADKDALEAFLLTLTDDALVEDPRFADPFLP